MATIKELKEMALHVAKGTAPANFTAENVSEAYRAEVSALCGNFNEFQKNKYDLYQIVIETVDEILPEKAISVLGQFAEIISVPDGQRALFKKGRLGKGRAKAFLTQVGLSGVYESARLDSDTFTVSCHAKGGAWAIDFERFRTGLEDLNELMDIVYEGMQDALYLEVQKALKAAAANAKMPARNKYVGSTFDSQAMQRIIGTVKAYGTDAVIFAAPEFIEAMGPDAIGIYPVAHANLTPNAIYHPQDIDDIRNTGRIKIFRGTPIVEIPQTFLDEDNDKVLIDPSVAYILPTGGEKVVKVVFEGPTVVYDYVGRDQRIEFNCYKKMGVGILTFHNWGIYINNDLWVGGSAESNTIESYDYDHRNNTAKPLFEGDTFVNI